MPAIKKPKPFVRATGSHYDKEKWKTVVDKTKFERKLDDMARRTDPSSLQRGDLFYAMNYDSSSGWIDDDEDYIEQKWWEVLEVQKMNHPDEYERACKSAKVLGYGYHTEESEFKDKRELKNFVLDNGGDWPAFRTAMSNMASQFAEARVNAYYN